MMTYAEYLKTPKGENLETLFRDYQATAMRKAGDWWLSNCVTYAVMMELWDFLSEDPDFCVPDEAAEATAEELFDRFLQWAHGATDVALVLTTDHGDERFEVIKSAFHPVWKKMLPKAEVRQVSFDLVVAPGVSDDIVLAAIRDAMRGKARVVGGPEFTDAHWTQEEYGL